MKATFLCPTFLIIAGCALTNHSGTTGVPNLHGKCDVVQTYDIDFQRFDEAAQQIAHATGCFIQSNLGRTGAIKPQPVQGRYSPRQAIAKAIEGTGLKIITQQPDVITVE